MVSRYSCFFRSSIVLGAENQLSNRTYLAAMPAHCAEWSSSTMASVALRRDWRYLFPARERPSYCFPPQSRFLSSAAESRLWLTGMKEFPFDHPKVSIRNPDLYFMEQWSKTLTSISIFLERSNRLSSTINTSFRFFVSQWLHKTADDFGGKQRCEALPVDPCVVQETVDGIF